MGYNNPMNIPDEIREQLPFPNGWQSIELASGFHVVPLNDLREHTEDDCWCNPTITEEPPYPNIVSHHAMDKREEYEEGRKPS